MTTPEHENLASATEPIAIPETGRTPDSWEAKFLRLYEEIDNANDTVDAFSIHCILVGFGSDAERARRDLPSR